MLATKNILLITDFDFEDGARTRDKFLVVLHKTNEQTIIAPLTTSVDYLPDHYKNKRCAHDIPSCIHCYIFPKDLIIADNGFAFWKDTFIHLSTANVKNRSIHYLQTTYVEKSLVKHIGVLNDKEYFELLYCLYKSIYISKGVKKTLEPIIETMATEHDKNSNK